MIWPTFSGVRATSLVGGLLTARRFCDTPLPTPRAAEYRACVLHSVRSIQPTKGHPTCFAYSIARPQSMNAYHFSEWTDCYSVVVRENFFYPTMSIEEIIAKFSFGYYVYNMLS